VAKRTASELAFEDYLSRQGIIFRYEELPNGITQPADYSFEISGKTLRIDVKEWKPRKQVPGVGAIDPYMPVRKKIDEGRKKFKQYKGRDEPCVLVLCHYGPQLIVLDDISIFGAMRGNLCWMFSINADTGVGDAGRTKVRFTNSGKMIYRTPNASVHLQNTTLSAIAVLKSIRVRSRRVSISLRRREAAMEHKFTKKEIFSLFRELYNADKSVEVEPCITVYDNLDAAVSLPHEFPVGPYDERFGKYGNRLCRTYVGTELTAIESEEAKVGIQPHDPMGLRT